MTRLIITRIGKKNQKLSPERVWLIFIKVKNGFTTKLVDCRVYQIPP